MHDIKTILRDLRTAHINEAEYYYFRVKTTEHLAMNVYYDDFRIDKVLPMEDCLFIQDEGGDFLIPYSTLIYIRLVTKGDKNGNKSKVRFLWWN